MSNTTVKQKTRARRHARVRAVVSGTSDKPRLSVYRSNKFMHAQLIDDTTGTTIAAAHDMKNSTGNKTERAKAIGKQLAEAAQKKGVTKAVFDRGGFKFAGRVKAVAEGARAAGLEF